MKRSVLSILLWIKEIVSHLESMAAEKFVSLSQTIIFVRGSTLRSHARLDNLQSENNLTMLENIIVDPA